IPWVVSFRSGYRRKSCLYPVWSHTVEVRTLLFGGQRQGVHVEAQNLTDLREGLRHVSIFDRSGLDGLVEEAPVGLEGLVVLVRRLQGQMEQAIRGFDEMLVFVSDELVHDVFRRSFCRSLSRRFFVRKFLQGLRILVSHETLVCHVM